MSVVVDPGRAPAPKDVESSARPTGAGRDPSTWAANEHINRRSSIPFIALHFLPLLAFVTGVTWKAVWLAVALYFVRILAITGGYHRYFAHRSYRLGRVSQFVLAFVRASGSLKEMGEQLKLSYPTVRIRLNEIIAKLKRRPPSGEAKRHRILDAIARGELSGAWS